MIAGCRESWRGWQTQLNVNPFLGGVFSDANLIDGDGRGTGMRLFATAQVYGGEAAEVYPLPDCDAAEARRGDRSDADVPLIDPALLLADSGDRGYTTDGWRG